MRILVTGASGFVGQALTRLLLARGHYVTALVRCGSAVPDGAAKLIHALGAGGQLALPTGTDAVVHLAQSRVYRSFPADAAEMFRVNVAGAQELLAAAAVAGVSRFCLVSSGTIYEPFDGALSEDASVAPMSYLGASKLAAEIIARPFSALFPVSVLRLFAPYGPGQADRLVPDLVRRVRRGNPVTLPERGGGMTFAPTYVDDICELMMAALDERWSGVFNAAAPEQVTIEHAATLIGAILGTSVIFERKTIAAPRVVPELGKIASRYDLARFRRFNEGLVAIMAAER